MSVQLLQLVDRIIVSFASTEWLQMYVQRFSPRQEFISMVYYTSVARFHQAVHRLSDDDTLRTEKKM